MRYARLLSCLFLFFSLSVRAQDIDAIVASIEKKLPLSDTARGVADLYLHTDKSVYAHTDDIWFTAYLLHSADISRYHTLYIALVNDMTQQPVCSGRYVLQQGLGSGNMPVPDSLQAGEYSLIAYTNRFLEADQLPVFRQPITLLGAGKPPYGIRFSVKPSQANDSLRLLGRITTAKGGLAGNTSCRYFLYADGQLIGQSTGKTDAFGEFPVSVSTSHAGGVLEIRGQVGGPDKWMPFKQVVQWEAPEWLARYYPEGGQLVSSVKTRMTVQVHNRNYHTLATRLVLLENGDSVASFQTDRTGIGAFVFTPVAGREYTLRMPGDAVLHGSFPAIQRSGYGLHVRNPIVKDSLLMEVMVPAPGKQCLLVAHDQRSLLFNMMVALPAGRGLVKLPVADWPQGLINLVMYDEQGTWQQACRVVVLPRDHMIANVITDSSQYRTQSIVTARISLKDQQGRPVKGAFSFSVAAAKTLGSQPVDIVQYDGIGRHIGQPPSWAFSDMPPGRLETVLPMLAGHVPDAFRDIVPAGPLRGGAVVYTGRKLKKPAQLLLAGESTIILSTDEAGRFDLPAAALRGQAQRKLLLSLVSKTPIGYEVLLDSTEKLVNEQLAQRYYPLNGLQADELSWEEKDQLRAAPGKLLEEVVITRTVNRDEYVSKMNDNGVCDDYVCRLGFLNCPIHPKGAEGTRLPVEGERYAVEGALGTRSVIYHCAYPGRPKHIQSINATWYPEVFYDLDVTADNPPELLHRTTLYWAPLLLTDDQGQAEVSFHTNLVTGTFQCMVQGITDTGVFQGKVWFTVR
ncbi:hypothetical protein [Paraflavitalea pollutisoli]|uniref:hypothetical protein n=1 Tax=Paraflavitalea pollutisoli TaxID=3034143 RepID=UPI0023ED79AB|nr:hypothetical protein [Paraflavitalea sp. H1-2-19X]